MSAYELLGQYLGQVEDASCQNISHVDGHVDHNDSDPDFPGHLHVDSHSDLFN